jgi:hypothetical protein
MAAAISCIFDVPWSAASTPLIKPKPTRIARIAVPAENHSHSISVPPRVNS